MASKRYDLCSPRPRKDSDKPFWHRVGTAFENDKGITLLFDSLPLPDAEGRVAVMLFEPRDRDDAPRGNDRGGGRQQSGGGRQSGGWGGDDLDDSIPF
jgi:hypothetical protein